MSITAPLPKAEAKIIVRDLLPDPRDPKNLVKPTEWRDCLDIDPIEIPVESPDLDTTDVYNKRVMDLVSAVMDADSAFSEHRTNRMQEYDIVWTETNRSVKGVCPCCDDVFPIAEGAPGDTLNEGFDAVWCGCEDDSPEI